MREKNEMRAAGTIESLCEIKRDYVDETLRWYSTRTLWPRVCFRFSGATVIVLSLAIPFLAAAADSAWYFKAAVPVASYVIALLSAFGSFFGWHSVWEKRTVAKLLLEGRIAAWEVEIDAARRLPEAEGYAVALKATSDLVRSTKQLTVGETAGYFSNVRFPAQQDSVSQTGAPPNRSLQPTSGAVKAD